jgi:anti-sigma B factor antagonist
MVAPLVRRRRDPGRLAYPARSRSASTHGERRDERKAVMFKSWPISLVQRGDFTIPYPNFPAQQARDLEGTADLRVGIHPGVPTVVEICGEIDILSAPQLRDELLRVVRRHGSQLALDLEGVTFIDCAGINVLLATRRRARLEDGWVRVTRASPPARRTISLLGLREAFALSAF